MSLLIRTSSNQDSHKIINCSQSSNAIYDSHEFDIVTTNKVETIKNILMIVGGIIITIFEWIIKTFYKVLFMVLFICLMCILGYMLIIAFLDIKI